MSLADSIVNTGINDLAEALSSGRVTSVDLLAKHLLRISSFDCRNTSLNAIPLLNEQAFEQAAAADDRRRNGQTIGVLDGIPFTLKDICKVKGKTVASGSEAFETLVANEDAFVVEALRDAGAILIGQTNMCPMAYGGMLRGVYGRAENPYNLDYLAAAFGSGSSNGSGVSVSSSFAAFGLGTETVSSGRSPASNTAVVAYTPSKGLISCRGSWPLYPTCDVIVPHTRSMDDLLLILDILTKPDQDTIGDFWRDQPFTSIPAPWQNPPKQFISLRDSDYLKGKRIAVPSMYIKQSEGGPYVSKAVSTLWSRAQALLEKAGAIVEIVDEFPAIQAYDQQFSKGELQDPSSPHLPEDWNSVERGILIANAWEDFLRNNNDPNIPSLQGVDPAKMFPQLPRSNPQVKFVEPANAVHWSKLAEYIQTRPSSSQTYPGKSPLYDIPNLAEAVHALEAMRKHYFEAWLDSHKYDFVAFPAAGDVARADADIDYKSAEHAWTDGVKYSNGNRALRHLGIPSVTVPMGILEGSGVPMGLTFLGKAYQDETILKVGYAFEQKANARVAPPLTPVLPTDVIHKRAGVYRDRVRLVVEECMAVADVVEEGKTRVSVTGTLSVVEQREKELEPLLEVYIDGQQVRDEDLHCSEPAPDDTGALVARFNCQFATASPPVQDERNRVVGKIARDSTMVMILARNGEGGQPAGYLKLIHASDQ